MAEFSGGLNSGVEEGARPFFRELSRIIGFTDSSTVWWSALVLVCIVLLIPFSLVAVPPIDDYPNHLARMFVEAFGARDQYLSKMYAVHWRIVPNLAIDAVLPMLMRFLPINIAGRMMLALSLLLPFLGVVTYNYVAFRRRSAWPLAASLIAYNTLFLMGFMNYLIGLGAALFAASGWVAWRQRHVLLTTAFMSVAATLIFFIHIFGLLFLAALIGGWELDWVLRSGGGVVAMLRRAAWSIGIGAAVFFPSAVLYMLSPLSQHSDRMVWNGLWAKLPGMFVLFLGYDDVVGRLVGVLFFVFIYICDRQRLYRSAPGTMISLLVIFVAYMVCPADYEAAFIDVRFPIMLGLVLFAGFAPVRSPNLASAAVAAAFSLILVVRVGTIADVWYHHNRDLAELRYTLDPVPPGSRVLIVAVQPSDNPAYWRNVPRGRLIPGFSRIDYNLPGLLITKHRGFWPLLFSAVGKQPIVVLPPYRRISLPEGVLPDYHLLQHPIPYPGPAVAPYLWRWRSNFDYVLVLDAGGADWGAGFLPGKLAPLRRTDAGALFRVLPLKIDPGAPGAGGHR